MNIIDAIKRYKELNDKNKHNGGLIVSEANEHYRLLKYIEEHIIEAIDEGYILVFNKDDN